jgi:hypothetical protein
MICGMISLSKIGGLLFPFVYDYGASTLGFSPQQCYEADLANCLLPQDNRTKRLSPSVHISICMVCPTVGWQYGMQLGLLALCNGMTVQILCHAVTVYFCKLPLKRQHDRNRFWKKTPLVELKQNG